MSNGDDVLDNWDEIDEAGLNNTLHKIQADRKTTVSEQLLSKTPGTTSSSTAFNTATTAAAVHQSATNNFQPMKLLQRTQSQENTHVSTLAPIKSIASNSSSALKSPLDDMSASFQPVMMVLHQPVDEYQSANYTAPISSQTVKILRRPTQSSEPRNNDMRPRQPIKTLQQREQEYAEARLRILGSAKNPEDDVSNATSNNTGPASTTAPSAINATNAKGNATLKTPIALNAYNNHQQTPQLPAANLYNNISNTSYNNQRTALAANMQMHQPPQQQQQTWSPIVGGMVSATTSQRLHQQESILRMPRGPDGSTGFQMRR